MNRPPSTPGAASAGERPALTPSTFAWVKPTAWTCPRCSTVILTAEAGPRCSRCGYVEGA